jgi:hypothetical protein
MLLPGTVTLVTLVTLVIWATQVICMLAMVMPATQTQHTRSV